MLRTCFWFAVLCAIISLGKRAREERELIALHSLRSECDVAVIVR